MLRSTASTSSTRVRFDRSVCKSGRLDIPRSFVEIWGVERIECFLSCVVHATEELGKRSVLLLAKPFLKFSSPGERRTYERAQEREATPYCCLSYRQVCHV